MSTELANWFEYLENFETFSKQEDGDYQLIISTFSTYFYHLLRLKKKFENKLPHEMTIDDLRSFIQEMRKEKKKKSYINVTISALISAFELWFDLGYTKLKPKAIQIAIKSDNKRRRKKRSDTDNKKAKGYTFEEMKTLLETIRTATKKQDRKNLKKRDWLIISMLYSSGLRANELFTNPNDKKQPKPKVLLSALDFENRTIHVIRKGGKERDVHFLDLLEKLYERPVDLMDFIKDYIKENELKPEDQIFKIQIRQVENICEKWGRLAGLSVRVYPHGLRHTFGRHLSKWGVNKQTIQALMDHVDPGTTDIYTEFEVEEIHYPTLEKLGLMTKIEENKQPEEEKEEKEYDNKSRD